MKKKDIIEKFQELNRRQTDGQYSPHKPLLVLYAIGKLLNDEKRLIPYSEVDKYLGELLQEFGSDEMKYGTNYPFWRLRNDSVWEVTDEDHLETLQNEKKDISRKKLLKFNPSGGFHEDIAQEVIRDEDLRNAIIDYMLNEYLSSLSSTCHSRILQAVGIEFSL